MNTILVTGGAGLIGSSLCSKLLDLGHTVFAVDNCITGSEKNITRLASNPKFAFLQHDITLPFPKSAEKKLQKITHIYHLACPTGVPNLTKLAEEMLATCSVGTQNILDLAQKKSIPLLFTSSSEVYGDPLVFPQTEKYTGNVDPIGIRSPYEEGKRFSESLIMAAVRKHNIEAKIVRIFNTYGYQVAQKDTRVISMFVKTAQANQPIPVEGDGKQTRTFCYVDDTVNGLLTVMEKGKKGEAYNLGSDVEITILELANLVKFVTRSQSKIAFVKRPTHDHKRRLPDLSKIHALGWKQTIGIYEGLQRVTMIV